MFKVRIEPTSNLLCLTNLFQALITEYLHLQWPGVPTVPKVCDQALAPGVDPWASMQPRAGPSDPGLAGFASSLHPLRAVFCAHGAQAYTLDLAALEALGSWESHSG